MISEKPYRVLDKDLGSTWVCKLVTGETMYLPLNEASSSEEAAQKAMEVLKEVARCKLYKMHGK